MVVSTMNTRFSSTDNDILTGHGDVKVKVVVYFNIYDFAVLIYSPTMALGNIPRKYMNTQDGQVWEGHPSVACNYLGNG